jgi:hypothetical protein
MIGPALTAQQLKLKFIDGDIKMPISPGVLQYTMFKKVELEFVTRGVSVYQFLRSTSERNALNITLVKAHFYEIVLQPHARAHTRPRFKA